MGGLVAGTMLRGMFEERIKGIIDEVKKKPTSFFSLTKRTRLSAQARRWEHHRTRAICLNRRLARGELRIIGATTLTEYKEYIGEDEALARRFRLVKVDEPTIEETKENPSRSCVRVLKEITR
jgi:ATP-dependent Clp protease ATP-binding subunit ClpA